MKHNTSQKGFTLIELIAVMVILGILAAVLIPRLSSVQESAYEVNAKQMYTALEAHLNMQSMQAAIQGAHGLKQFPNVTETGLNYYAEDWLDDFDSEHWTQYHDADGGSDCDGDSYDAVYFIYHPHDTWSGTEASPGATTTDFASEIVAKKDNYYITYFPITNSNGKADGIPRNEFHLALHSDSGLSGGNKDNIADNDNTDPVVDNLMHCGGDNKADDGVEEYSEAASACGKHTP